MICLSQPELVSQAATGDLKSHSMAGLHPDRLYHWRCMRAVVCPSCHSLVVYSEDFEFENTEEIVRIVKQGVT